VERMPALLKARGPLEVRELRTGVGEALFPPAA